MRDTIRKSITKHPNIAFTAVTAHQKQKQVGRTKRIRFYEFDTTLWDSPHRYGGAQ